MQAVAEVGADPCRAEAAGAARPRPTVAAATTSGRDDPYSWNVQSHTPSCSRWPVRPRTKVPGRRAEMYTSREEFRKSDLAATARERGQ